MTPQQQQQQQQQHFPQPSRGVLRTPTGDEWGSQLHKKVSLPLTPLGLACTSSGLCMCFCCTYSFSQCRLLVFGDGPPWCVFSLYVVLGQKTDPRLHLWRLLLLGGDVEPNPGPVCGVCRKSCTGRGPKCGECSGWMHLGCSGMRRDVFYGMEGREEQGWRGRCCVVVEERDTGSAGLGRVERVESG